MTSTPLLMRLPKSRMLTHASSVPGGLFFFLLPLPMSCFSWGWKVPKPQLPSYSAAYSVFCCIVRPGTTTPPSTGSRSASHPGSQGPTLRGPSGPAGILPPKAKSWATSKVGLGLFPVRVHKYFVGGLPHLHQVHYWIHVLPHIPGRAATGTFPLAMRRQGQQPLQRRRRWVLQVTTSISHSTFDYSSYSSHCQRGLLRRQNYVVLRNDNVSLDL